MMTRTRILAAAIWRSSSYTSGRSSAAAGVSPCATRCRISEIAWAGWGTLELTRGLPLDDDDHMPPDGKPQPSDTEVAILQRWIETGAKP